MSTEYPEAYTIYRARTDGNGVASQWSIGSKRNCVFLEMSSQKGKNDKGNAIFDWDNKISFKLGDSDIGEILAVLIGRQEGVGPFDIGRGKHKGLFHSNQSGNAVLYFSRDKSGSHFNICLSVKKGNEPIRVQHTITNGEACLISTLLRRAIEIMYKWD